MAHRGGQRRRHAKLPAQRHHGVGGRHAFGHAVAHARRLLHAQPLAQVRAERVVAAQRRPAGGDQIAHAREPAERLGVGAGRLAQRGHLGQAARLDHRGGVLAIACATRHADGERDHVLQRSAHLQSDDVGGDERLEIMRGAGMGHTARIVDVRAGDDGGGRLARGDLLAQIRSGDGGEPVLRQAEGLGDDLVHPFAGGAFDALHQGDDDGVAGDQVAERFERDAGGLRGNGDDDDLRSPDGLGAIAGGGHVLGETFDAGQADGVVVTVADAFDDFGFDGPHRHVVARIGQHLTECRAPRACAQYRDLHRSAPLPIGPLCLKVCGHPTCRYARDSRRPTNGRRTRLSACAPPPTRARASRRPRTPHIRLTTPGGACCGNPSILRRAYVRRGSLP